MELLDVVCVGDVGYLSGASVCTSCKAQMKYDHLPVKYIGRDEKKGKDIVAPTEIIRCRGCNGVIIEITSKRGGWTQGQSLTTEFTPPVVPTYRLFDII